MPFKEIVVIAMTVVGAWYVVGGHRGVMRNLHKVQIAVLRDLGKTSHWGNPSPWHYRGPTIR